MRRQFEASPGRSEGSDRQTGEAPDVDAQLAELNAKPEYRAFARALQRALASEAATQHRIEALLGR
jgi:hypothetical protein